MISKEIYDILRHIPHAPKTISFEELQAACKINDDTLKHFIEDEAKGIHNYINLYDCLYPTEINPMSLSSNGIAEIEAYEDSTDAKKISVKSYNVSIISCIIAAFSLFIAVISLFIA